MSNTMEQNDKGYIYFYLKPEEKRLIKYICNKLHLSMSAFVRSSAMRKAREEYLLLKPRKEVLIENE